MNRFAAVMLLSAGWLYGGPVGDSIEQALAAERSGRALEARESLERTAEENPRDPEALLAYAEFLDRYGDAGRREAYRRALDAAESSGSEEQRVRAAGRLATLALAAGDRRVAERAVQAYRQYGGEGLREAAAALEPADVKSEQGYGFTSIPGILNSFQRMAALSTDLPAEQLFAALARNVVTSGYRSRGGQSLQQTEYLKLLLQYLSQARELEQFAGADQSIDIPACESTETGQLLKILGFRLRNECGPNAVLETVNPSRAFLSIDAAFPLAELEEAYRTGEPFHFDYRPIQAPVLFGPDYWVEASRKKTQGSFVEGFLNDPAVARLYVAMSKLHRPTATALKERIPAERLKNFAHVLDFFGGMFEIRDGAAVLPGGSRAAAKWEKFVGVSPSNGAEFFQGLIETDDGWLAAFFDSMMRVEGAPLAYYTEPQRLERFYLAVRGRVTSPGPARPIFRSNAELMLLITRLHFRDGKPHISGGVEPWKNLFIKHPHGKYDGKLTKSAAGWREADDLVEAMFGLCRKAVENEPLKIFLAVSNVDRARPAPLNPATVERLILAYPRYGAQFTLFNEAPSLSEQTIVKALDVMAEIDDIGNDVRRADAIGTMQALTSLWQIFVRQGQIPAARVDQALRGVIEPFEKVRSWEEFFDAGRAGVRALLSAAGAAEGVSPQDSLIGLLAGDPSSGEEEVHEEMVKRLNTLFNQQRLVSVKTLFDLADHLERVSRGESFNVAMANRLAATISDVRLPRANLSTQESAAFAHGYWVEKHIREQRDMNLRRMVDKAQGKPRKLLEIRGEIAPVLRDSLVGLVYIYYSPPGAELIRANPLFVRSHDFLGADKSRSWSRTRLQGSGWPNSAGGRLVGSVATLPYALADAEQNFLVPSQRQALIWQDLAPQILLGATVPRWWGVRPSEMHFVGLHLRLGEALLQQGALDAELREKVFAALGVRLSPARRWRIEQRFAAGRIADGSALLTPAEQYDLARKMLSADRDETIRVGAPFASEIVRLLESDSEPVSYERAARLFGTPHPELARSYRLELLHLPLYPTLMGYSSRVLAESWESTNLYWAALADEAYLQPAQLNLMAPEWTRQTLERIFATHLEDWPALLRSMIIVGQRYRQDVRARSGRSLRTAAE